MKHIFMLWKVLMVCLLLANPLASYADFYNRQIKKFPTEKQNVSLKHILT